MNDRARPVLTALCLALGIATPAACAHGLTGEDLFGGEGEGGEGGAGGASIDVGVGGHGAVTTATSGPSATTGPTSTTGAVTSTSVGVTSGPSSTSAAVTSGISSSASGGGGDCCQTNPSPGCNDGAVAQCVCAADSYCCSTAWDSACVSEVDSLGCGSCGGSVVAASSSGSGGGGFCCQTNASPGCGDPNIENCVCPNDDYCCTVEWDSLCVDEVTTLGCGSCP